MSRSGDAAGAVAATARALQSAARVVVTTGAGMSRESATATFRVLAPHGSLERFSCVDRRHPFPADQVAEPEADAACEPPRCPRCGAAVRPDVVWFGEQLPERVTAEAWDLAASCQARLVVGTSGLVQPAAQLLFIAREAGAMVVEVHPDPTEVSAAAHSVCRGQAGAVLAAPVAALAAVTAPPAPPAPPAAPAFTERKAT
jgi:NAD-dependent deacetylase